MFNALLNRLLTAVIVFGLLLQGCRPNSQVASGESELTKLRKTSDDAPIQNQVSLPVAVSSVVADVPHSGLPTAASVPSPSAVITMDPVASLIDIDQVYLLMHYLAVGEDDASDQEETSSMESEEEDKKPAARPTTQVAALPSADRSESLRVSPFSVPSLVFGAAEWRQYFGEVEEAPPLPLNIVDTLNGTCPFWPDRQVKDTHLLVLMPATVNGKPFSLNLLRKLIKRPDVGGHSTRYRYYDSNLREQFGFQSPGRSYWVLMTREVLEGSRGQWYSDQQALVSGHARRTQLPYELPGALEAATAILSHHVRSGERLYTDSPYTYTGCRELVDGEYPIVVGGFSSGGLRVGCSLDLTGIIRISGGSIGVAGFRKL